MQHWTHKQRKKIIGCSKNWTYHLSLCSWTTFQYTRKADGDIGLAVILNLSCCIYYMTSRPMNINQPWKAPWKTRSYLLSSLHMEWSQARRRLSLVSSIFTMPVPPMNCQSQWMGSVTSVFHLHNASATHELSVSMDGQLLKHEHLPLYLGVTLDRTLSYRQHLQKTAAKVRSRNNLLSKVAGSSWGADAVTLWTSAIALCYSVAEYCCPVWSRSAHTNLVNAQLNTSMRLISGTLR